MFRWLRTLLPLCVIVAGSACVQTSDEQPASQVLPTETANVQSTRAEIELVVYSLLLKDETADYVVVLEETVAIHEDYEGVPDSSLLREMSSLSTDTLDNFKQINLESSKIPSELEIDSNVVLISQAELDTLIDEHGVWDKFNQKYENENEYYAFSRVGLNSEMDQALVYRAYACGGECGKGEIYFLEKIANKWYVTTSFEMWVA